MDKDCIKIVRQLQRVDDVIDAIDKILEEGDEEECLDIPLDCWDSIQTARNQLREYQIILNDKLKNK